METPAMNVLLETYRQEILRIASSNKIASVKVFGSFAKNEATPDSDLDLLVELQEGATGFALGGFLMDVEELTGRKVDVVTENALHPTIRNRVLAESIAL